MHWSAEVYADADEVKKNMDHSTISPTTSSSNDCSPTCRKGVDVAEPTDPLHDSDFIRALIATYTIAPTTDWAKEAA